MKKKALLCSWGHSFFNFSFNVPLFLSGFLSHALHLCIVCVWVCVCVLSRKQRRVACNRFWCTCSALHLSGCARWSLGLSICRRRNSFSLLASLLSDGIENPPYRRGSIAIAPTISHELVQLGWRTVTHSSRVTSVQINFMTLLCTEMYTDDMRLVLLEASSKGVKKNRFPLLLHLLKGTLINDEAPSRGLQIRSR